MIAFSADNAAVNYGVYNSIYQKLLQLNPNIIKANCNCHVLHNMAKHTRKTLKFDVESLVLKIYNEFSTSSKRYDQLKEYCKFLETEYKKLLKHIPIRWLTLYTALDRLLLNWTAVKMYF